MLAVCTIVFGGIFGFKWFGNRMMNEFFDSAPVAPVTVSSAVAYRDTWPNRLSAVGTVRAEQGADITTETSGIVDSLQFTSGGRVEAGQIIATLDRATDAAELDALMAQAELAEQELSRAERLYEQRAVPQSELDRRAAEAAAARALVAAQQARIARKVIRAPFGGLLGIRKVDLGQYISPGTPIVSLQSLDPIYVNFKLPQQRLSIIREGMPVTVEVEAFADHRFAGTITAIEPAIDTSTRNFEVQATFANPRLLLRPGMFAQVEVDLGQSDDRIVVPQTAVSFNPYGDSVWILDERDGGGLTAERRVVQTGRRRGDLVEIEAGLDAGTEIATSGLLKLRNGIPVMVNNDTRPSALESPTPPNN